MQFDHSRLTSTRRLVGLAILVAAVAVGTPCHAVQIEFDYSHDANGFFDDPLRREVLELAAKHVNRFVDQLDAIVPGDGNGWFTYPPLPPSGADQFLFDMEIPADTLKVFVGGNNVLPELHLAQTNPSGIDPWPPEPVDPEWHDLLRSRGQAGALESPPTDYGHWGGVSMYNGDAIQWHFGLTTEGLDPHETDFLTVAVHELMHIFGFGPAESFQALFDSSSGLQFNGSQSLAVGSANNPNLEMNENDGGHWRGGTLSYVGAEPQEALMGPVIAPGERRFPTSLDRAALRDVGWEEALPGDANLDREFDPTDIVMVSQAAKYLTGEIATWADGDWNDDFVFDPNDIVAALATGVYSAGPDAAVAGQGDSRDEQTSLVYDAETGEVAIEVATGTELTSINIESATGVFTGEPAGGLDGGLFDVDEDSNIFKAILGGGFGSLSFGNVAAAGLDESFLLDDLTVTGSLAGGGLLQDVDWVYLAIPEPAAWIHAAAGILLLFGWRRIGRRV